MTYAALLDANIIYPAPVRDLFLQLAMTDIFKAKWTADIHREWIEAMIRNQPHRDRVALERTRELMDSKVRDCLVTGYEALIPVIELPDPGDRHLAAAAISGRCDVIVTQNLKHFPEAVLAPYGIAVQHPDEFLCNHLNLAQGLFCSVVKKVRNPLKRHPTRSRNILASRSATAWWPQHRSCDLLPTCFESNFQRAAYEALTA